jgi:hypothetical protein
LNGARPEHDRVLVVTFGEVRPLELLLSELGKWVQTGSAWLTSPAVMKRDGDELAVGSVGAGAVGGGCPGGYAQEMGRPTEGLAVIVLTSPVWWLG